MKVLILCLSLLAILADYTIEVLNISLFISDANERVVNISTLPSEIGLIGDVSNYDLLSILPPYFPNDLINWIFAMLFVFKVDETSGSIPTNDDWHL